MNKNSLLYKIITNFTTILAVILVAASILLTFTYNNEFYNAKLKMLDKQGTLLSEIVFECLDEDGDKTIEDLEEKLDDFKTLTNVDVLISDKVGYIYAASKDIKATKVSSKIDISNEYLIRLEDGEKIKFGEIGAVANDKDVYLIPIIKDSELKGVISMILPQGDINDSLFAGYKIIWIYTLATLILAVVSINYFTKKQLVNPLREIYLVANKLARGEVDKRIEVKTSDEIGELAKSFNLMAESLEAVDKNRREFISNVSHELRSPITSMKGFIAGMLDGVIPKDKENYYLKLVYDEINRLSRLVNDLLDISSMEVGKFKLTIMEVDINSLVKRCLLNVESKVKNKGIRINATLENEHLYVYADSDRIMQVLTNILDNAIKYGKKDGTIDVSTRIKGPKVHISIYNDGSMMSDEEISHIWDRFYKSDKSRTNKESTGLGLPIVRLIMSQHKEDVWVKNEREGVTFTFTLAKV